MVDENQELCKDDLWFTSGMYILQRLMTWDQMYFALSGPLLTGIDFADGMTIDDYQFSLCQQSGYWDACPWKESITNEGKYFRQIAWRWLYFKDIPITGWTLISCTSWATSQCSDTRAKEFRFCSKVVYVWDSTGEVQFCGVMTNFKGK